ncbi:hypothetical protein B0E53_03071 [Micromonospora sp. MH33]|nr:hypothetical protein B0E53_03071 [Micromonospora sp. MH33]
MPCWRTVIGYASASPSGSRSRSTSATRANRPVSGAADRVSTPSTVSCPCSTSSRIVWYVKMSLSWKDSPRFCAATCIWMLRMESPPRAKKLSVTPKSATPSTSRHASTRISSARLPGVTAAPPPGRSSRGAGSAARSSLPLRVSGSSSRSTTAAGSRWAGSRSASQPVSRSASGPAAGAAGVATAGRGSAAYPGRTACRVCRSVPASRSSWRVTTVKPRASKNATSSASRPAVSVPGASCTSMATCAISGQCRSSRPASTSASARCTSIFSRSIPVGASSSRTAESGRTGTVSRWPAKRSASSSSTRSSRTSRSSAPASRSLVRYRLITATSASGSAYAAWPDIIE